MSAVKTNLPYTIGISCDTYLSTPSRSLDTSELPFRGSESLHSFTAVSIRAMHYPELKEEVAESEKHPYVL